MIAFVALTLTVVWQTADSPLPSTYPAMSNQAADDMAKTYAFCVGQQYSIEALEVRFPALEARLHRSQQRFESTFGSAVASIDAILSKENTHWNEGRRKLLDELRTQIKVDEVSLEDAKVYATEVENRAEGEIPSPFLETLLIYNPKYLRAPADEFLAGYSKVMDLAGNPKAAGVSIRLQVPTSWRVKDGNHPRIVAVAISENGRGDAMIMVQTIPLPLAEDVVVTESELEEIFGNDSIKDILGKDFKVISSKRTTLEALPSVTVECESRTSRLDLEICQRQTVHIILFKNKLIVLYCGVATPLASKNRLAGLFDNYSPLLKLIANSLVIREKWVQPGS